MTSPAKFSQASPLTAKGLGLQNDWLDYTETLDWGPGQRDQSGFHAFLRAGSMGIDPEISMTEVINRITRSGGSYNPAKLHSQRRRAYECASGKAAEMPCVPRLDKVCFDPGKLKGFAAKAPGIDQQWLKQRSPVTVEGQSSTSVLDALYEPGERVIIFDDYKSQGQCLYEVGRTKPAEVPQDGDDGVWYLVNPVDGQYHPNPRQENQESRRSEESVTAWRYLVLESDIKAQDQWLSALVQLPLKISAIYASGNKSIHALVRVDAKSKPEWDAIRDRLRRIMVPLGADPQAMTAVRLSRLPGAMRGDRLQELLYLNPNPQPEPILKS